MESQVQQNKSANKIVQNLLQLIQLDINENRILTSHCVHSRKENVNSE